MQLHEYLNYVSLLINKIINHSLVCLKGKEKKKQFCILKTQQCHLLENKEHITGRNLKE